MTVAAPVNPFAADVAEPPPPATTFVVLGGTGDLARRKLIPAVYNLAIAGRLPERFRMIGVARRGGEDAYREGAREALARFSRTGVDAGAWEAIRDRIGFERGDLTDPELYRRLARRIALAEEDDGGATRRLFYLAVAPRFFEPAVEALAAAGLAGTAAERGSGVIVEKPFGHDLRSAMELDEVLHRGFREDQIFRIDHYLGKEMTQNLLVLRFANAIFEPIWNRRYVDHVQITVAEDIGTGDRGGYYDSAGALRDVIQNHALQLLSLVAMEPPVSFAADDVRDEKVKALRAIAPLEPADADALTARGRYEAGVVGGEPVPAYREEPGVAPDSDTETYAALRVRLDNWRWAGTPFYLRSGKRMPVRATEIAVVFRAPPHLPLPVGPSRTPPNELVLSVQPNEGATLSVAAKTPGAGMQLRPVQMDFRYGETFLRESPEAYERLVHDAMQGDQSLFTRADEVEAAWRIVDPVLAAWAEGRAPLEPYPAGTAGPGGAEELIAGDGRAWREL